MDRRHVAIYISNMETGGAQRVVLNQVNSLSLHGHKIDLVLTNASGAYLPLVSDKVRIVNLQAWKETVAFAPLSRYLKQEQPDILFANSLNCNVSALTAAILSRTTTRIVVIEHNMVKMIFTKQGRYPAVRNLLAHIRVKLARYLYPKADTIITVSKHVADDIRSSYKLTGIPIVTIHNPIIVKEILSLQDEAIDDIWFQEPVVPIVLAVGRLVPEKNYSFLIEVFSKLNPTLKAKLIILGDGEQKQVLEEKIRSLGLENKVRLPGNVSNPYKYMKRSKVLVVTSITEGFPMCILEALACGCPVVSSDYGGANEILEDDACGRIVSLKDQKQFVAQLEDALCRYVDKQSIIRSAERYDIKCIIGYYLHIIMRK